MKGKRLLALLAIGTSAAVGLMGMPSANAASGVFVSTVPLSSVISAQSYNLLAVGGLVNVPPTEAANCGEGQEVQVSAPTITVPQVATLSVVAATCAVAGPLNENVNPESTASVAKVSLLGGKIVLTGVRSQCFGNPQGFITTESTIATVNGVKISLGAVKITIPGLATIALDQNSQTPAAPEPGQITTVRSVGVLVQVLPYTKYVLGKPISVPAQTITVDTCSITGVAGGD